jgi:hypothetical protein
VARGGEARRSGRRGLLLGADRLQAGPDCRKPPAQDRDALRGSELHGARDSGVETGDHARLPDPAGHRRPGGLAAVERMVPDGQVAGACGSPGRARDGNRDGLVVGLGHLERGRSRRRQGRGRLRLPLDAGPVALRRPGRCRPGVRDVTDRGSDPPRSRTAVLAPGAVDPVGRAGGPATGHRRVPAPRSRSGEACSRTSCDA